ncbi:carbohydrate porin [Asaia bogorensis]|uniref:Porin n=2 Tax=Asaia TaxID=91914 RepID=A0AAN4U3E7_9PROT|nr:carbohydrate porin [Asaia bogorensis]BAT19747.1 porin B carbohydrate-selective OprB [Asaia bogorensis NBRC 16594]GBQ77830.1 porin [Asaia bogorensis NBRC 16594]GEL54418.1 porin [Asaia bogorensis NBRC 16594]
MPVKNAAGRLALWAAGTILGSCLLIAPASAQSQSQQASPSDQTAATLDPMLKETATQNHAGKGADNPPNLYGSPYDRTQPSLGTVRHPFVPVPGNEALFPASFSDWLKQPTMTGDWGGLRTRLQNMGITPQGHYLQDSAGNPTGGRAQTVRYAHEVAIGADVNFAQLTGHNYGMFHVLLTERAGLGIGQQLPALNSPQEIFGSGETIRFTRLSWEMQWNRYADTEIGWINTENDFGQSTMHWGMNLYCQFESNAICGMPQALASNSGYGYYPTAHPGAFVKLFPFGDQRMLVSAGIYNVDPTISNTGYAWKMWLHGSTGAYLPFQLGRHFGGTDTKGRLPTNVKIGGYWDTSEVKNVYAQLAGFELPTSVLGNLPIDKVRGRYGGWFMADQMLQRDRSDSSRSTVAFLSFTWGDPRTAIAPYFITWGVVRKGTFWNRPNDTISIGGKFNFVNPKLGAYVGALQAVQTQDTGLLKPSGEHSGEINYGWRPAPWLTIRPGLQYIWHPGGTNRYKNALLIDLETGVSF